MSNTDKAQSSKNRRVPKIVKVKSARHLTPNMRRVTLHGEALADFPEHSVGAYIKLLFNQAGNTKPAMRTYTIAEQRSEQNEIDVDFMLHTSSDNAVHGIAAPWSLSALPGDEITLSGPGPAKFVNTDAEYFLLAADMTALPALTENLRRLPETAKGQVYIEILTDEDKQDLPKPEKVQINWVVNHDPGSDESPLFHEIARLDRQDHNLAAWVACEFKTMKKIRQHLKVEIGIEKTHLYISSYWKKGNTEEQHKIVKRDDAQQLGD